MNDLEGSVDRIAAETAFSGVVRIDRGYEVEFIKAYGFAHRGWEIPNESTRVSRSPAGPRDSPL
jgi:hypothetical protein